MKGYLITILVLQVIGLAAADSDMPPKPWVKTMARFVQLGLMIWAVFILAQIWDQA